MIHSCGMTFIIVVAVIIGSSYVLTTDRPWWPDKAVAVGFLLLALNRLSEFF